jgi:GTP-binding protein
MFVDKVKISVKGGGGGDGVTAFERQPYEPRGRPNGGDGGHGGNVILRASTDVATLLDYHHRPHRTAERGRNGEGDLRRGHDGADVELPVPVGTVVRDAGGEVLADLVVEDETFTAAAGGRGGRGNAAFRTSQRRAPRFHEYGEPPQERWVILELKLMADVALVGFPNAGKSSIISRLSAAKPKIADYPFTTLAPNLGVVQTEDADFVVADVPGLIEGASTGKGLGHQFLRHVERAGVLVHVLDCASYEQRDPSEDLRTVCRELERYQADLLERPALVFLNKTDADPETAGIITPDLQAEGWEVLAGSAVTGAGMDLLRHRMASLVTLVRSQRREAADDEEILARPVLRPLGDSQTIEVTQVDGTWRLRSPRIERWVVMTDLENEEAVRYLQSRMTRAGVDQALMDAGAERGDAVEIAGAVFDFEPETLDDLAEEFEDDDELSGDELSGDELLDVAQEPDRP